MITNFGPIRYDIILFYFFVFKIHFENEANSQHAFKYDVHVLKNHSNWLGMTLIAMNYAFMYKSILMPCHHILNSNSYNED